MRPFVVWSVQRIEDSRAHVTVTEPLTVSRLAWRMGPAKDTSTEPLTVFTFSGPSWPSTRTPPFTVDRTRSPARFAAASRPFTVSASSASAAGSVIWYATSAEPARPKNDHWKNPPRFGRIDSTSMTLPDFVTRISVSLRRSESEADFTFLTATTWSWSPPDSIWIEPFTFWTLTLRMPARSYFFSNRSCVASSALRPGAARAERARRTGISRLFRVRAEDGLSDIRSSHPRERRSRVESFAASLLQASTRSVPAGPVAGPPPVPAAQK